MVRLFPALLLMVCPFGALADTLKLSGRSQVVASQIEEGLLFDLPIGVWDGTLPTQAVAGTAYHQVLYFPKGESAIKQVDDLTIQLIRQGYDVKLSCRDITCGGFDFRFALRLIPPPDMFVDLGYYKYVSALHPDGRAIAVLGSRTQDNMHLHLTFITPADMAETDVEYSSVSPQTITKKTPVETLETTGRVVLDDLEFRTGSSKLAVNDFESLQGLATYLSANPSHNIALVGHTDAVGSLSGNIALSKKRATSVRAVLVARYGVDAGRVTAQGVGYLSPIGLNTTPEGRAKNRRVEAIVTSTQ